MCDDNCYYGGGSNYMDGVMLGIVLAALLMAAPAIPVAMGGWYIGEEIIGNNFAKWGLAITFFLGGYYIFMRLLAKGTIYGVLFVAVQYLTLDTIFTLQNNRAELYVISIVKGIIAWGVSNT